MRLQPCAVSAAVAMATWDSWRWYANRLSAAPEEGLALALAVALLAALGLPYVWRHRITKPVPLVPVAVLLFAYAAASLVAPPIVRAGLAALVLLFVLYRSVFAERPPAAFYGLVLLAMPVLPSLHFVLGYPMRIVSAILTVALLELQSVPVSRQGTYLIVRGEMLQFDAPCSGVSMLWVLVLITLMAGLILRLPWHRLAAALLLTVLLAIVCNALRVASLIYAGNLFEEGEPPWLHEGVGLAAFLLTAGLLAAGLQTRLFQARSEAP